MTIFFFYNPLFSLFVCINDRTKTDHGDVGRYVRESALINLKSILVVCSNFDANFEKHMDNSIAQTLKRCSDTVDKTRAVSLKDYWLLK